MPTTFARLSLALALLLMLVLPGGAQTATVVHVMTVPIDAGAEVYYAKDMGFFTKAGLDVEIQQAANGGAAATAVAGNAVDIGYSDMVSIASAFGHNVPFIVIAPAGMHETTAPTNLLMVSANSNIHSAKDLSGKVVAGSGLGTISGFGPRAWIEANGGDLSAVKFVELPFPQMQPALDAGRAIRRDRQGISRERVLHHLALGEGAPRRAEPLHQRDSRRGGVGQCQPRQERRDPLEIREDRSRGSGQHGSREIWRAPQCRVLAAGDQRRREVR
jgi:hypothetical protein